MLEEALKICSDHGDLVQVDTLEELLGEEAGLATLFWVTVLDQHNFCAMRLERDPSVAIFKLEKLIRYRDSFDVKSL